MSKREQEKCPTCDSNLKARRCCTYVEDTVNCCNGINFAPHEYRRCRDPWHDAPSQAQGVGPTRPYAQGRLDEFLHMKKHRPIDPTYWDIHHERDLREVLAQSAAPCPEVKGTSHACGSYLDVEGVRHHCQLSEACDADPSHLCYCGFRWAWAKETASTPLPTTLEGEREAFEELYELWLNESPKIVLRACREVAIDFARWQSARRAAPEEK